MPNPQGMIGNFYQYDMLSMNGFFKDRTKFFIDLNASIRERIRPKAKGDKYKMRLRLVLNITLVFSQKEYEKLPQNPPRNLKIIPREGKYIVKIRQIITPYQTQTTIKGNKPLEYFNVEENLMNKKVLQPQVLLANIANGYKLFKPKA